MPFVLRHITPHFRAKMPRKESLKGVNLSGFIALVRLSDLFTEAEKKEYLLTKRLCQLGPSCETYAGRARALRLALSS